MEQEGKQKIGQITVRRKNAKHTNQKRRTQETQKHKSIY